MWVAARVARLLPIVSILLTAAAPAVAQPASTSFQGSLRDATGAPLTGSVAMTLGIWSNEPRGATRLYAESHAAVSVVEGVFDVALGAGAPIQGTYGPELFAAPDLSLEVAVNGEVLAPRLPMRSVGSALRAEQAAAVGPDAVVSEGVEDGSLTAADIADEPGVVFGPQDLLTTTLDAPGGINQLIETRLLRAPRAGFVVATANLVVRTLGTGSTWNTACSIRLDESEFLARGRMSTEAEDTTQSIALTGVAPVSAGDHRFDLLCSRTSVARTNVGDVSLTLMYFPSSYISLTLP